MSRIKLTCPIIKSRPEAETLLGEIAALSHERDAAVAALNAELTRAKQKFEGRIDDLKKDINEKTTVLQAWAEANPAEFGQKKSIEFMHGNVGFRTGTPKLKTLPKWTWDRALEALKTLGAELMMKYVRLTEEVNKSALLADYSADLVGDDELRRIGCVVVQDESFFVELKTEPLGQTIATNPV